MKQKIGIVVIATNKYIQFIGPLTDSIRQHFLPEEEVSVFVFTNQKIERKDVVVLPVEHRPWPGMTLYRYKIFTQYAEKLNEMDYLYYLDADMRVVSKIGAEVLPKQEGGLLGTIHPGFHGNPQRGTYENRPASTAYLPKHKARNYYAGGFNGGRAAAFLQMAKTLAHNIDQDTSKGITAIWHDESHLNRYLNDHPPELEMTPSYCYPESWNLPFEKKILALDKDHNSIRS